jgi:hypothetical protein
MKSVVTAFDPQGRIPRRDVEWRTNKKKERVIVSSLGSLLQAALGVIG